MQSAVLAIVNPSVCPSICLTVCHTLALSQNDSRYNDSVFTAWRVAPWLLVSSQWTSLQIPMEI